MLSLFSAGRKNTSRARKGRRLQVEPLEDRSLLSVQVLATLGNPAPGPGAAGFLINDFEPNGLNNHGDVLYGADLGTTSDPSSFIGEAVYLQNSKGQVTRLAGSTDPAPGGGTYDSSLFYGPTALNDQGDAAITFQLSPFMLPFGVNGGTYRFSHDTNTVTPVVVPFVTPAPGGGVFQGTVFAPTINNRGDLLFDGIVPTDKGIHLPDEAYIGLGEGIFKADKSGHIASVVSPGDKAPGGGKFDFATGPWLNDGGDVAFEGHVAGELATVPGGLPQSVLLGARNSVYVKNGATGKITSVAHVGDAAPGGGAFQQAYGAQINNAGDIIFIGDLTPAFDAAGLFRYSKGVTTAIARPGDAMPGGGHLVTVSLIPGSQSHINNQGDIVFNATLDTDVNGDHLPDTGLYQWSHGQVSLVVRTGTVLAGVGTIQSLTSPSAIIIGPVTGFSPTSGAINNDRGQVFFSATLTDGRDVLLLLTPGGKGQSGVRAAPSAAAAPAAGTDLSGVAAALALGDQNSSRLARVMPTSHPGSARGGAAGSGLAVVLSRQATISSSAAHTSHHSAVDDFFATFSRGLWNDALAPTIGKAVRG